MILNYAGAVRRMWCWGIEHGDGLITTTCGATPSTSQETTNASCLHAPRHRATCSPAPTRCGDGRTRQPRPRPSTADFTADACSSPPSSPASKTAASPSSLCSGKVTTLLRKQVSLGGTSRIKPSAECDLGHWRIGATLGVEDPVGATSAVGRSCEGATLVALLK